MDSPAIAKCYAIYKGLPIFVMQVGKQGAGAGMKIGYGSTPWVGTPACSTWGVIGEILQGLVNYIYESVSLHPLALPPASVYSTSLYAYDISYPDEAQ